MGAGSEAQNRSITDWLMSVDRGQIHLPSFQRGLAWPPKRVVSMLNTVIHDLPLGVALVLNVGGEEKFVSRPLVSAPETTEPVTEHLLDGQQRLTALYRALNDNDPDVTYFVHFPALDENSRGSDREVRVQSEKRWQKGGTRFPVWADNPRDCLRRGLVPVRLLHPRDAGLREWVEAATADLEPGDEVEDVKTLRAKMREAVSLRDRLTGLISEKREAVRHFNLPYLRLSATTSKDTALRVFVNMNTNASPLKPYDIVVAEVEASTGRHLKEMEKALDASFPRLRRFISLENAVLQTSALMQSKVPNQQGYYDMDYAALIDG